MAGLSSAARQALLSTPTREQIVRPLDEYVRLVEEASREDLSPVTFFDRVLEREIERKDERRIATSLKLSGLPVGKTLDRTSRTGIDGTPADISVSAR